MHFDFAAALVLGALITGVIWAVDAAFFAPRRREAAVGDLAHASDPVIVDYARSFFPLIVIVLVLRSFVGEPFRIPSGSMLPTLLVGDFILVNKFAYGLRLPVVDTKILDLGAPQRGDVVVFRYPQDPSVDFIKRVVGLPGDRVSYRDKQLFINGEAVPQAFTGPYGAYPVHAIQVRTETLSHDGHQVLVMPGRETEALEFSVPEGEYFVMGDNRDNSNDSREWGTVPERNLVGRAVVVWMSWVPGEGPLWSRLGTVIH
ncbi:MAG: signal peptidase I [Gammaproteobacteria bacterium]